MLACFRGAGSTRRRSARSRAARPAGSVCRSPPSWWRRRRGRCVSRGNPRGADAGPPIGGPNAASGKHVGRGPSVAGRPADCPRCFTVSSRRKCSGSGPPPPSATSVLCPRGHGPRASVLAPLPAPVHRPSRLASPSRPLSPER